MSYNVTATEVKTLRELTGVGMMHAKTALIETNGDQEAAIVWLRTKNLMTNSSKSSRPTNEGLITIVNNGECAAMSELNCETDFVARNPQFQSLAKNLTNLICNRLNNTCTPLQEIQYPNSSHTVADELKLNIATIGENIKISRHIAIKNSDGIISHYVHNCIVPNQGKIGVLVSLISTGNKEKLQEFGHQLAMHIAAAQPLSLNIETLDYKIIEQEKEIISEQAKISGKSGSMVEKIVEGKMKKFYEQVVLLEQPFVIDGKTKIKELLKQWSEQISSPIEIEDFKLYILGK